jgi:hypothetical protein
VINQLGEKLLTEKELKWIIPAAEFESLLKNIGKNYKINLPMVYLTIQYYLWGRVYVAIIEKYRFKYIGNNKRSYYDFAVTEINSIDRKTKIKTEADLNWNLLKENSVGKIENVFGEGKTLMTVLHNANSSRWDDILIPMYHECFVEKKSINKLKHSENHKFQTLYPLYARLMQNRKWPNEEFLLGNKKGQADLLKYSEKMRKFIVKK